MGGADKMRTSARFILSRSACLRQYEKIKGYADCVSYSFKTNREVGYVLRDNSDSMFSVHSLMGVRMLNCPERIWYFSQAWDDEEISEALGLGVRRFVVDNINDLERLLGHIRNTGDSIGLLLRMRLKEHTIQTGKHFVYGMFTGEIKRLLPELRKSKAIKSLGIHFHRKTQNISEWSLREELEAFLGRDMELLGSIDIVNIGGGMPSVYKNFSSNVQASILSKVKSLREWLNGHGIKMMAEPGRFIAAPAVKLETTIKNIYNNNIIVDCSVYSGMMDTFVSHIRLMVEGELESGEAFTIKGKTPDSMDILRYRVYLDRPKVGDKIVFLNAGAYTYSTDFCGLEKLPVVVVD